MVATLHTGGALVTANHVSFVDGPLVALTSPVPLVFTSHTDFSRRSALARRGMAFLARIGCGCVVPLDPSAPFGLRRLVNELKSGASVMVFPEGQISASGGALPDMAGLDWLVRRTRPARVTVEISGAEQSRIFGKRGTKLWPRITLEYTLR